MIEGRWYQTEAVDSLYDYFRRKAGNPVLAMPTGTGKSVVIALFLHSIFTQFRGQRVLVLTHVKELIQQNYDKLMALWPQAPAGVYSAGLGRREMYCPITFAGVASIVRYAHLLGRVDLVIVDEAHLVSPSEATMYQKVFATLKQNNPFVKVIGLTATPWRLGHGHIAGDEDSLFTDVCYDITGLEAFNRLIAEGYLAPLVPKPMRTVLDTAGVHMRGGEFVANELQMAVDRDEITAAALQEMLEYGNDRRHWLVFASGVEHATHVCDALNYYGIDTTVVHGKLDDKERDRRLNAYKAGEYRCIVNNNILTTGFDMPAIDLIGMLRPTASPVLWVQMLGRGTRPFECEEYKKENCLVLDFAGNTRRLGPINDPVVPRRNRGGGGEAPIKECPTCNTLIHASLKHCPHCNHEFVFATKLEEHAGTNELIRGDLPIVEVFEVNHITYGLHFKAGAGHMLRVSYYCQQQNKRFDEFVCFEHQGFALRKAREWWAMRSDGTPMPAKSAEALELAANHLRRSTHLRVWVNKGKYPQVMAHCFDGTAFGTQAANQCVPQAETSAVHLAAANILDDDIPF